MADGIASSGDLELGQQIVAEELERATAASSLTREMHGSRNGELQIGSNSSRLRTGDDPSTADLDEHDLLKCKLTELCLYILEYNLEGAKSICDKYPEVLRIPLLWMRGDTALHITVELAWINFEPDKLATWLRYITSSCNFSARTHLGTLQLPIKDRIINFVQQLLERMVPEDLQIQNIYGDTALHVAVKDNNIDCSKLLVERMTIEGLQIPNKDGNTALHVAVSENNIDCLKLLVERMTTEGLQIPNKDGNTALHIALSKNNIDCSKLLVEHMTTKGLQIPNKDGNTALHLAVATGLQDNFTKLLIERMNPKDLQILNKYGYTALHVAVSENNIYCLELLGKHMTIEGLQIRNKDGNTAFCVAATLGHDDCLKIMVQKNNNLPLIPGPDDMLPVHFAAFIGHHKTVQYLACTNNLNGMDPKDIERLFFMTISNNIYDVAADLVDEYPHLATARENKERLTALHMLARKPLYYDNNNNASLQPLLEKLWSQIRELEYEQILDLVSKPSIVLFDAVKSGNYEAVKQLLYLNRELMLWIKDSTNGRNLLHIAALYRRERIFDYILGTTTPNLLNRAVDNDHNNVLHLAATMSQQNEASLSLRPGIQMHKELVWFEKASGKLPSILSTMKNKNGQTPKDVFYADHSKLYREVKDAATQIANFGMIVAVLIVAVAFAAAVTVPGDKTNNWFIVFILANAVAIFTSSASIVFFLSIFTSRFSDSVYIITMHPCVKLGLTFVLISIAAMVVAFVAASLLIFDHTSEWVGYVVGFLGIIPVTLMVIQFSYSKGLIDYLFWSKYYGLTKIG